MARPLTPKKRRGRSLLHMRVVHCRCQNLGVPIKINSSACSSDLCAHGIPARSNIPAAQLLCGELPRPLLHLDNARLSPPLIMFPSKLTFCPTSTLSCSHSWSTTSDNSQKSRPCIIHCLNYNCPGKKNGYWCYCQRVSTFRYDLQLVDCTQPAHPALLQYPLWLNTPAHHALCWLLQYPLWLNTPAHPDLWSGG
jgi:hypothetical protein